MLLETRLRVNALSTHMFQVNSDSLIVAIRSLHECEFKRIAANARSHFARTCMQECRSTRIPVSLRRRLDSLFYIENPSRIECSEQP
jgi:hypothetical protein